MADNYLIVGDNGEYTITGDDIIELKTTRSNSILLDQMSSDVCEAKIVCDDDFWDTLPYGTKICIMRDVAIQDVMYLSKVTRIKQDQYQVEMTSFFGILDSETYYGGYFTGENFQDVVEAIIQTNGLDPTTTDHADMLAQITYDEGVAELPVYGWIRVVSKREALHQVLFSRGISMKRSSGGAITFAQMYDLDPTAISESNTYENGDVKFLANVSHVEIEEHTYTDDANQTIRVLFENRQPTDIGKTYIAVFNCDTPVLRNVTVSGLTVVHRNCNAAIVTGIGSISGYPSVHSTTMIKEQIKLTKGDTETIRNCTMITIANSAYILDRIKNYYLSAETEISTAIARADERTGSHVSIVNSFGERVTGIITQMTETYSGIVKADCKIITGYHPVEPEESDYSHSVVLSGSGGWVVPASVYLKDDPKIKVVLVGGGSGGDSGKAGGNGNKGASDGNGAGGAGGAAGLGGIGGKIYEVEIENPSATLYFTCGAGGSGGAQTTSTSTSNAGSAGGDTTLTDGETEYSSSSGERNDSGVTNFLTGMQYGINYKTGRTGLAFKNNASGAKGGSESGEYSYPGDSVYGYTFDLTPGSQSYAREYFNGGYNGTDKEIKWYYTGNQSTYWLCHGAGGSGGGAAVGANGGNGGNASGSDVREFVPGQVVASGEGGTGATPPNAPPKPNEAKLTGFLPWDDGGFGNGGFGGYGGGGYASTFSYAGYRAGVNKAGGSGGKGGQGGAGGDGCILIYY